MEKKYSIINIWAGDEGKDMAVYVEEEVSKRKVAFVIITNSRLVFRYLKEKINRSHREGGGNWIAVWKWSFSSSVELFTTSHLSLFPSIQMKTSQVHCRVVLPQKEFSCLINYQMLIYLKQKINITFPHFKRLPFY